jgi:hypothetical protein
MLDSLSGSHRSADTIRPRCRAIRPLRPRSLGGVKRKPGYTSFHPGYTSTNEWRSRSRLLGNERWLPPHRHGAFLRADDARYWSAAATKVLASYALRPKP